MLLRTTISMIPPQLVMEGDSSVERLAENVGWSVRTLHAFRRWVGQAPGDYRNSRSD